MKYSLPVLSLTVALIAIAGCGGPDFEIAPVSGRVTLDGEPLAGAHVSFQPVTDVESSIAPGPGSYATTDDDGRFTLQLVEPDEPGAVVGRHRVRIARGGAESNPQSDVNDPSEFTLPASCRDGSLEITVPAGGTDAADVAVRSDA